jgi:ACT domain-containing protein
LSLDDKPGQLVKIVTQIAELKGNIVSVVTQESKDSSQRKITIKATGVTQNQMEQIFASLGVVPEDLRVI